LQYKKVDAARPALRLGATESASQMPGFKQEQDDAYCNAPIRQVEGTSEKTPDAEVHEVSESSGVKRSIK
jgi:hypothetical protein